MIDEYPNLLPVLSRFGIELGMGERTIGQVCLKGGINPDFFLSILNAYNNPEYFHEGSFKDFPMEDLIRYLRETHAFYLDYEIPRIEELKDRFVSSSKASGSNMELINRFFNRYVEQLIEHIKEEEDVVFPYLLKLHKNFLHKNSQLAEEGQIPNFNDIHKSFDEELLDIKNLIIRYLPSGYDKNACNTFLIAIHGFAKDLLDHARIEDRILIPMVKHLEGGR